MGEFIQKIRGQITEFINSLDNKKKIMLAAGSVLLVLFIAGIIFMVTRTQYVTLSKDLTYNEMGTVTAKLDELGISWKDDGASTIFVPINDLTKSKMALAMDAAIGKADYTWTQVFANSSFTQTSEVKRMMINQATASTLQGMMIDYIDGVIDAKVTLFIPPDQSALLDKKAKARASVTLKLEEGVKLSEKQVKGIEALMINSIDKLDGENITIMDQTGIKLNDADVDMEMFEVSTQYEQQQIVENRLEKKLREFLGTLYGDDNVDVIIGAKLDFNSEDTTQRLFSPPIPGETTGMIRSANEIQESVVNDTTSGVPGTDTNSEITSYPNTTGSGSNFQKASSTLNYELNEIQTVLSKARGQVEELSVAVILNTTALVEGNLTEAHKSELTNLISTAAGLDTKIVTISAREFYDVAAAYEVFDSSVAAVSAGVPLWLIGIILAVVLLTAGTVYFLGKKKKAVKEEAEAKAAEEERKAVDAIQMDREDTTSPKYQIEKFIDAKPDAVAQLLRSWINED